MYNCIQCSSCCRSVATAIANATAVLDESMSDSDPVLKEIVEFPYEVNRDGSCSKLTESGTCSIYKGRPLICDVDKMYDKYWSETMSRQDYYDMSSQSCENLRRINGSHII